MKRRDQLMNRGIKILAWSLVLMVGLLGPSGLMTRVSAAGVLPTFKAASPARFDLTGSITVGPSVRTLQATGSQSGDQFQQDMVITPASGSPITFNSVQVGTMYYFKLTGNDQWQSIDLSTTPGNVPTIKSDIPGLNGFNPNGGLRTYEAASSSQEAGKETINGVATTKYQAGVDLAKLYTSLGTPAAQAAQIAAVSKMTLYLWVGDSDQVLHQQRVVLNSKAAGPGGALLDVIVDFTIKYHDIGTAVSITAPANAVPYAPQPTAPAPAAPASPPASPQSA